MNVPTVLLVDDFELNIEILKGALARYNTITASNGIEALEKARGEVKPDLILLDVVMPDLDGYQVCKILKRDLQTKDIPVIFITSKTDQGSILKGFEVGAIDYIIKPFNILELKVRVRNQLAIKIARDQNHRLIKRIEDINYQITASIEYAKKIQNATFPKSEYLDKVLPEHFVLLMPRDIVSGDFYWVGKIENKTVVVVADCTGHGVPGAFMSMFGVAYLNEIIGRRGETKPADIINELRRIVISSFQQNQNSELKDGMDISIIAIDFEKQMLEFSGAFNPMLIIKNDEITICPADHMPVSFGEVEQSFSNHVLSYEIGDCIYLFSDGYASQFGGEKNKKLKQIGFKQLLLDNYKIPMREQKGKFEDFFCDWMGENDQIDDVLLMGIRL